MTNEINTTNEFLFSYGHKRLSPMLPIACFTRQQAYRAAAYLVAMSEVLPEEPQASSFKDILKAVRNI